MIDPNCITNKMPKAVMTQMIKDINKVIGSNETIIVAMKGIWREYLVCTDSQVYIIKRGLMTGHTFGGGVLKVVYPNITNAEVVYHMMSGYFELSSGGLENKHYQGSTSEQPNCISINRSDRKAFEEASSIIMRKAAEIHSGGAVQVVKKSVSEEIREYKALCDDGIITKDEFEKKKKELLNQS